MILERRDRIRTLRAVGRRGDPLALRLALDHTLGAAELHPGTLPRGAVLCVRRMRVAMPDRVTQHWASALGRRIPELVPRASRPFRGTVPTSADAVLFLNEAELLACLARDWRAGGGDAWWWRALFGESATEALVRRAWIAAPQLVPAVLELLAQDRGATDVVRALPASYCEELGRLVATAFAVPGWADAGERRDARPGDGREPRGPGEGCDPTFPIEPFQALRRTCDFGQLAPPQRALLGMALLLQHAPRVARMPWAVQWLCTTEWLAPPDVAPSVVSLEARAVLSHTSRDSEAPPRHAASSSEEVLDRAAVADVAATRDQVDTGAEARLSLAHAEVVAPETSFVAPAEQNIHAVADSETAVAPSELFDVESDFAGVAYLINLALHLGLYAEFTQPEGKNLPLPIGDFLALVGESACGADFREDPVWILLARWSGRGAHDPPAERVELDPPLERLIEALAGSAARAIGVDQSEVLRFLCHRAGALSFSATRLDVTFPLASHPLEIRIAGLDRDPGWVPAAGRVIAFHYE